jgi:hypothetical protein
MEERIKYNLQKIFKNAEINIKQDYGIIYVYIQLGNYFLHESKINLITERFSMRKLIQRIVDEFFAHFNNFTFNESAFYEIIN